MTDEEFALDVGQALKELNAAISRAESAGLRVVSCGNVFNRGGEISISVSREKKLSLEV